MRGTFRAVGEFETSGPDIPVVPLAAAVLAVALAVWLATILLIVAVVLTVLAGLLVAAAVLVRRRYPDYSASLAEQAAALRADMPAANVVEHHHYMHLPGGVSADGADWALPLRDAVIRED